MNTTTKKVLLIGLAIIVGYWLLGIVFHLALNLLAMALPFVIVAGVVYVLYQVVGKKALGGGRRTLP